MRVSERVCDGKWGGPLLAAVVLLLLPEDKA